ncbi:hypothetical protein U737_04070 [Methylomonas sp. LW13]|uniref:hypothetical protein n=1 Tax=unclassified Methylomonas TaxID=2608980 RepID=UPI00051B229E|nr:hypothetical protein [Methylomonas sp. LW13]QBC26160.1 hypothetical protein U737_04070 [Methylomonas sp. LW13]
MLIHKLSFPIILLSAAALFQQAAYAQDAPSPQQALQNFGIGTAQIPPLERGEIIAYDVSETSQKELAIGVAMIIPVGLPQLADYIKKGKLNAGESDIVATGMLGDNASVDSFKKFAFTEKQVDEAKAFLEAEPGDEFNLSKAELDSLKSLQAGLEDADNKTLLKTANQKYREFLLQRLQAYKKSGLAGIAPYSRDGGTADPAAELRNDAVNSKAWARYFPELQQAWLNYPAALPANTSEQFLWLNRRVEDRPTAVLNHRVVAIGEGGGLIVSRQFYVGHSYNSSHVVAGGLPYKGGTLVFYSIRSSTDQVAGMGSSLKHSIGREQMKKEMIKRLQRLNKDMKLKPAAVASEE